MNASRDNAAMAGEGGYPLDTAALIAALSADSAPQVRSNWRMVLLVLVALVVAGTPTLWLIGLRPDFVQAMTTPPTLAKWLLPLAVALVALSAALARSRPEARTPPLARWGLVTLALTAVAGFGLSLGAVPRSDWAASAMGHTARFCMVAIPVMALAPLAALIVVLRRGASTAPARSGALAGLAAGGAAATIYAMHCREDAPLFFMLWYGLGILASAGLGALAGRRWLSW